MPAGVLVGYAGLMRRPLAFFALLVAGFVGMAAGPAWALKITLDPPAEGEFVRDLAGLVTPEDERRVREIASRLLEDADTPIIVVTIESMAEHGGADLRIETFATLLFDQWGVGQQTVEGKPWDTGILLLVSEGDRKARIELGRGWRREYDVRATRIMDGAVIPRFKQGDFSGGIVDGVRALDTMAREMAHRLREERDRAEAVTIPPMPPDPERQPVERPDPGSVDYEETAPPALPPEEPVRSFPRDSGDAGGPIVFDEPTYPTTRRPSSGVGGFACLAVLVIGVVVVMFITSLVRRTVSGVFYAGSHGLASGVGSLLSVLAASSARRHVYGHGHGHDNDSFFTHTRRRRGFGSVGGFSTGFGSSGGGFSGSSRSRSTGGGGTFGSGSRSSSSPRSSGSSSRSSFGRGSSGGGGATGSW